MLSEKSKRLGYQKEIESNVSFSRKIKTRQPEKEID